MAQTPRLKIHGDAGHYHVVTRVNAGQFRLQPAQKHFFVHLLTRLRTLYYARIGAYCVLDNHYHLLVGFTAPEHVDPAEAMARWNTYHAGSIYVKNERSAASRAYVVAQLTDISSFMKRLNAHLTRHYNKQHDTQGTLWERRYGSTLVERGPAAALCGAYIELNSFRAGLASTPQQYPWSSLYHLGGGNAHDLVDTRMTAEGLPDNIARIAAALRLPPPRNKNLPPSVHRHYTHYLAYVYTRGADPKRGALEGRVLQLPKRAGGAALTTRIACLTQGKAAGSQAFVEAHYGAHVDLGYQGERAARHRAKWIHALRGDAGVYSLWSGHKSKSRPGPGAAPLSGSPRSQSPP